MSKTQMAYDQIAQRFAEINAAMPPELIEQAGRVIQSVGVGARVLDVGCGHGRDAAWFASQGMQVVGVDFSRGMLIEAQQHFAGALLQMDMRALAFQSQSFDAVWCNAALLHLPKSDAPHALAEIRRVIRPGGMLALGVQEGQGEGFERAPIFDHLERFFARYDREEMATMLSACGFSVHDCTVNQAGAKRWLNFLCNVVRPARSQTGV